MISFDVLIIGIAIGAAAVFIGFFIADKLSD